MILRQRHEMHHRTSSAHAGLAAIVVEGDQALLEPPGADTETAGATELIGHRAGDAVAACGGIGVPRPFRRRDERFVLRSEAIDEGEG